MPTANKTYRHQPQIIISTKQQPSLFQDAPVTIWESNRSMESTETAVPQDETYKTSNNDRAPRNAPARQKFVWFHANLKKIRQLPARDDAYMERAWYSTEDYARFKQDTVDMGRKLMASSSCKRQFKLLAMEYKTLCSQQYDNASHAINSLLDISVVKHYAMDEMVGLDKWIIKRHREELKEKYRNVLESWQEMWWHGDDNTLYGQDEDVAYDCQQVSLPCVLWAQRVARLSVTCKKKKSSSKWKLGPK